MPSDQTTYRRHRHLAVVAPPDVDRVAVMTGGDALRTRAAAASGRAVCDAIGSLGLEAVTIETGPDLPAELEASGARVAVPAVLDDRLSDGTLNGICSDLGISCLGADHASMLACFNKAISASRLRGHGVLVPPLRLFTRGAAVAAGVGAVVPHAVEALGPDLYIKPCRGSGGIGVKRVPAELAVSAITNTFNYDDAVVVQAAVAGEEFSVLMTGVVGEPMAVGVAHVEYASTDPHAAAWARRYRPAGDLDRGALRAIVDTARETARALGLSGLATIDLIVDADARVWVMEADAMVDWRADGKLAACLDSGGSTLPDLLADLPRDQPTTSRQAA